MKINYMINGVYTSKSLTEWYIGAKVLKRLTDSTVRAFNKTGLTKNKFWLEGTGWLTIIVEGAAK